MPPQLTGRGGSQTSPHRPPRQNQPQVQNSTTRRRKPESDSDEEAVAGHITRKSQSNSTNSSPQKSMTKRERHEFHQKNDLCFRCEQPGHRAKEHDLGGRLYQPQSGHSPFTSLHFTSSPRLGGQVGGRVTSQGNTGRVPLLAPHSSPSFRQSPPRSNMQPSRQVGSPFKRSPELRSLINQGEWRGARKIEGNVEGEQERREQESTPKPRASQNLRASQAWLMSRPPAILDESVSGGVKTVMEVGKKVAVMTSPSEDLFGLDSPPERQDGCGSANVEDLRGLDMELVELGLRDVEVREATQGERQVGTGANANDRTGTGAKEDNAPGEQGAQKTSKLQAPDEDVYEEGEGETVVFRGRGKKEKREA
jgi:hypothetical protein